MSTEKTLALIGNILYSLISLVGTLFFALLMWAIVISENSGNSYEGYAVDHANYVAGTTSIFIIGAMVLLFVFVKMALLVGCLLSIR